jgi:DHA2 family methylenomycin A resistance protein-like MFS transporter
MCVGMFLVQLDVTVVNVALPRIRTDLGTDLATQQWVVDAYAIVLASLLLAGGTIGDRYGHKRVILTGLGLFGLASLVCGIAPNAAVLICGRAAQGLGAALLLPGTLAVVTRSFPDRGERARAVGIWAGVSALALPAGPLLGGALVSGVSWRWVFLINLPIVLVTAPAAVRLVRETANEDPPGLDPLGTGLTAVTLAAAVFAVINAGYSGADVAVRVSVAIALLALVGLGWWERRYRDPVLPVSLLASPGFAGANLIAAAMNLVGIGTVFVATLYLQTVRHHTAFIAGCMLLPLFTPLAGLAPVTGRLTARYGPRLPMSAGLLVGAAGSLALLGLDADSGYLRFLPALIGLGVGMGLLTAAVVAAAVNAAPADRAGLASGANNTARQAAGALAVAMYGAIAGSPTDGAVFTERLHVLGALGAALWLVALALTWLTIRPGGETDTGEPDRLRRPGHDGLRRAGRDVARRSAP